MLAQNISLCGNLFAKFFAPFNFNREAKILSSAQLITATRVVQKGTIMPDRGSSAAARKAQNPRADPYCSRADNVPKHNPPVLDRYFQFSGCRGRPPRLPGSAEREKCYYAPVQQCASSGILRHGGRGNTAPKMGPAYARKDRARDSKAPSGSPRLGN